MTFDEMFPYVAPYVPACPEPVMREHIRWAARKFAARTELWQVESTPILTSVGTAIYPLDLDDDQELVRLLTTDATVGGVSFDVLTPGQGRAWARRNRGGRFLYLDGPLDLVLSPVPILAGEGIIVQMVVKPALSANEWPDEFKEYADDIGAGAIASLCLLPKKSWTDRQQAGDFGTIFADRVATVGWKVSRGSTGALPKRRARFL